MTGTSPGCVPCEHHGPRSELRQGFARKSRAASHKGAVPLAKYRGASALMNWPPSRAHERLTCATRRASSTDIAVRPLPLNPHELLQRVTSCVVATVSAQSRLGHLTYIDVSVRIDPEPVRRGEIARRARLVAAPARQY